MDLVNRLSYLFGTEETVRYRRQLVLLREKILTSATNDRGYSMICSGSLGEGVSYPPSDDDHMYVHISQKCHVYDNFEEALYYRAKYMTPSEYSPGFCVLLDTNLFVAGVFAIVSSQITVESVVKDHPGTHRHGPCASINVGYVEYDFAVCSACPRWPEIAYEWIIRKRKYGWPSRNLVEQISKGGCHVEPIGNPNSPLSDLEWRVSFSLAERSLIHAFNHVQFIVYNLLKLILKRVIDRQVPNALCSYFLKTVLYYTIENTCQTFWMGDSLDECYRKCLLVLYHFIDTKNCPNYFIPENNMMRRKVNSVNSKPLRGIVRDLMSRGIVSSLFLFSEKSILSPSLSRADIELQNDHSLLDGYLFTASIGNIDTFIRVNFRRDDFCTSARSVATLLSSFYPLATGSCDLSVLNLIMKEAFTSIGLQCVNISSRGSENNMHQYQILRFGQEMLKIGCKKDVSSGRLQLANFMFMTGRFTLCLMIIQCILSKTAPYVISRLQHDGLGMMYKDVICNNGYSFDYKVRKGWALGVDFIPNRHELAPFPVKIFFFVITKLTMNDLQCYVLLHPLAFAYFLQGLCYYQMRDIHSMETSVTLLEKTVEDIPCQRLDVIFFSILLLGYLRMLQKNYDCSCRCITSALSMKEKMEKR